MPKQMRLEDAMMYCLVNEGRVVSTTTYLSYQPGKLHRRKDGNPVTEE